MTAPPAGRSGERRVLVELLAGGGRQIAAMVAGLVVYTVMARWLKAEKLGAWSLLGTISFQLAIADLGLTTAVQRAAVAADAARARRAVALALVPLCTLGPLAAGASYLWFLGVGGESAELQEDISRAAVLVLVGGVVSALGTPYRGYIMARGRANAVAYARTAQAVTHLAVVALGFAVAGRTLLVPSAGLLLASVIELAITLRVARAIDPLLPLLPAIPPDRGETWGALREGSASLVISVSTMLAVRVDAVVLSRVAPLAVVASYGVASRAVEMIYMLTKQATAVLQPRLGDPARREGAVRVGTGVFCGVIAVGMGSIALNAQPLLVAWVGAVAENDVTATVLAILALASIVTASEEMAGATLTLSGRTAWATAVPAAIGAAVNLSISVLGAPRYGIWAVAGSTVVGSLVKTTLAWINASKLLGYGARDVARAFAPPVAGGLASLATSWALRGPARAGALASAASCAGAAVVGAVVCGALLWWLSLRPGAAPAGAPASAPAS
ncbi:lipopolysaccharide biosynthesis protein [Sorangium sp. So ce1024]|uniref:lipopolysaccharide biosynthesis protein n=1 Tax=Sorangium sp. So ce1024 TaxID=3133327 RepID=UPI003EFF02AB